MNFFRKACGIVSIFFCLIFGIISLVKSCDSRKARDEGDIELARKTTFKAKRFAIAGIVIGTIITITIVFLRILQVRKIYNQILIE